MKFAQFPVNYSPMQHVDKNGTPIDEEAKHGLPAGWLQAYTSINQILEGRWQSNLPDASAEGYCSFTPWAGTINLKYSAGGTKTLTFPTAYNGYLQRIGSNTIKEMILVSGLTVTFNADIDDIIVGSLAP